MQESKNSNSSISNQPTSGKYQQKWGESPLTLGFAGSKFLAVSQKAEYWTQPNTPWNFTAWWTALGKPLSEEDGKPVPHSVCWFFWQAVGVMQEQDISVRNIALESIWAAVLWCFYIVCSLVGISRRQGKVGLRCWLLYPHLHIDFCKKLSICALALMISWSYSMF